jgi:hypothetical protein
MGTSTRVGAALCALWLGGVALAQTPGGPAPPGFITVSLVGVGGVGAGLAGDARLPVTGAGARFNALDNRVTIVGVGRRGAVRRIELDVPDAHASTRIELGPSTGATARIVLDSMGPSGGAEASRGFVLFETLTPTRGVGRYEATFQQGQHPLVARGQFQVNFSTSVGGPPGGANPGPGPSPPPNSASGPR